MTPSADAPDGPHPPVLVGRDTELAQLRRAWARARAGQGGLVLVAGEPGIGKTSLVAAAADAAQQEGAAVGWGDCPAVGALPYLAWRRALRRTVPTAARLLENPSGSGEDARYRLFADVADALADAAPTVLVLDDLQWADPAGLQLLHFLSRGLRRGPVLVLGTYRDAEVGPGHGLLPVLDAAQLLSLSGLAPQQVAAMASALGADAEGVVLHGRTGGNPFLVEQLCAGRGASDGTPVSALALVGQRLLPLSAPCRALLDLAAVTGRRLDVPRLAAALGRPPSSLLPLLDEAVGAGVLSRAGSAFAFRHDLMREAVLERLSSERTAALHWHLGSLLAHDPDGAGEAAQHLQAGVLAGDVSHAVEVTLRAAEQAAASLALEQAAAHLQWAVEHGPADADLLVRLGEALLHAGDWDGAAAAFERAAARARTDGDALALALAALGFGAGLAGFEIRLLDHRQIDLLQEAATALEGSDHPLRAYVLARLSVAVAFLDLPARRARLAREAVDLAERTGDPAVEAYALATWADVVAGPDHVQERLDLSQRVVELATAARDDALTLLGHRLRVVALLESGSIPELDRTITAFTRLAERYRLPLVRWYVPLFAGMRALMRGELDEAMRLAAEAEEVGAQAASVNAPMLASTLRLAVCREQGTMPDLPGDVRENVLQYTRTEPAMATPHVALGGIALLEGDLETAARCLDALVRLDFGSDDRDAEWLGTLAGATDLCVALGATGPVERLLELLQPYAGLMVVDGIAAACLCAVDEVLGTLAGLLGRPAESQVHLERAALMYEAAGMPLALERVRRQLGTPAPRPAPAQEAVLRCEGDVWLVAYAGREVRVPDAKGWHDLAVLLREPGREVHVAELVGAAALSGPVDVVVDEQARRAYRQRLRDLDEELEDAEADGDVGRAERVRAERDALLQALAEATGLGGRARSTGSDLERARQSVRSRFRHLLGRLDPVHPELARHLRASVRTGVTCCYLPEHAVRWDVAPADVRKALTPPR